MRVTIKFKMQKNTFIENQQPTDNNEPQQKLSESLQIRLRDSLWGVRKEAYEQLLYLIDSLQNSKDIFYVGGKPYNSRKLIQFLQDLVDQQHPTVLLLGLACVEKLLTKQLCSGKSFVKLMDKGFDKFPLRVSRGKQIMQKFAEIIQLVNPQPSLLANKLSGNSQKCVMYALEIIGMLGMHQLSPKVKQISKKHPKKDVKQIAREIYEQLNEEQEQKNSSQEQNDPTHDNIALQTLKGKKAEEKAKNNSQNSKGSVIGRSQLQIIEKLQCYQQLKPKDQQKYSEDLCSLSSQFTKLPQNQMGALSYVLRLMIESNNHVINCNALKILKTLIINKSNLIPKSYPLLFIFQKFKLHSTHQINAIIFQFTDTLLQNNTQSIPNNNNQYRIIDLMQAIIDGASSKKSNIRYGCVYIFLKIVLTIFQQQQLYQQIFQTEQTLIKIDLSPDVLKKVKKLLPKCYDSLYGIDKKYDEKLNQVKLLVFSASTPLNTQVKVDKKPVNKLSKIGPKIDNKAPTGSHINKVRPTNQIARSTSAKTSLSVGTQNRYRQMNPQQKLNKILSLANQNKSNIDKLKQTISESIKQFTECLEQNRFQLFYYCELIDNFIRKYQPKQQQEESLDRISDFLVNLLVIISQIGQKEQRVKNLKKNQSSSQTQIGVLNYNNLESQGLSLMLKICTCDLFLGAKQLEKILYNLSGYGIQTLILESLPRIEGKIKKKNRKILLNWIDSNVPHGYLCDQLFLLMEKIQNGKYIGENEEKTFRPQIKQKVQNRDKKQGIQSNATIKLQSNKQQGRNYSNLDGLSYDISHIEHQNDESVQIEEDQYLKNLKTNRNNIIGKKEAQFAQQDSPTFKEKYEAKLQDDENIQKKWEHYEKKYEDKEKHLTKAISFQQKQQAQNKSQNKEEQEENYLDIESYKKYIAKIRQSYLPEFQSNSKLQQSSQQAQQKNIQIYQNKKQFVDEKRQQTFEEKNQQEDKFKQLQERLKKMKQFHKNLQNSQQLGQNFEKNTNECEDIKYHKKIEEEENSSQDESQSDKDKEKEKFDYKIIDSYQLQYVLKSISNPYPHLRNSILIPFKTHPNKQYFLKQLIYFFTQDMTEVVGNSPQPYNAILLLVVVLFAEIQTDKSLISPLQQLYQFMASLSSTNQFLKTIISLFHSVIEETTPNSRSFLITILTKSVSRLMAFAEDPIMLLRDLSQFYNIGQNVYFQMYKPEYQQIKRAIQGEPLYELVEKALLEQGEHLIAIVDNWFDTQLKQKVKGYIEAVIQQNGDGQQA